MSFKINGETWQPKTAVEHADQIIDKNDEEFNEEYNALRDRKEALIEQIDNRLEQIGFYD